MNSNRLTGIFFLIASALSYFILIPKGIVVPNNIGHFTTSPSFWPNIIIGIIALMSLLMIFTKNEVVNTKKVETDNNDDIKTPLLIRIPRLFIVLGLLFSFYYFIEQLGMVVPGMVLIFILMTYAGYRKWWLIIFLSLFVPVLLYVFFVHVANIPIPLGIFESLRS